MLNRGAGVMQALRMMEQWKRHTSGRTAIFLCIDVYLYIYIAFSYILYRFHYKDINSSRILFSSFSFCFQSFLKVPGLLTKSLMLLLMLEQFSMTRKNVLH